VGASLSWSAITAIAPRVQRWRVAVIATMLTTITAAPRNMVQRGARIAANTAVISHAHANANVAIAGRASFDTLGLVTAAASASKIKPLVNTLNRATGEVIAAAPLRRGGGPAWLHSGDELPGAARRSYILPRARG
jgi:hypothetical protein